MQNNGIPPPAGPSQTGGSFQVAQSSTPPPARDVLSHHISSTTSSSSLGHTLVHQLSESSDKLWAGYQAAAKALKSDEVLPSNRGAHEFAIIAYIEALIREEAAKKALATITESPRTHIMAEGNFRIIADLWMRAMTIAMDSFPSGLEYYHQAVKLKIPLSAASVEALLQFCMCLSSLGEGLVLTPDLASKLERFLLQREHAIAYRYELAQMLVRYYETVDGTIPIRTFNLLATYTSVEPLKHHLKEHLNTCVANGKLTMAIHMLAYSVRNQPIALDPISIAEALDAIERAVHVKERPLKKHYYSQLLRDPSFSNYFPLVFTLRINGGLVDEAMQWLRDTAPFLQNNRPCWHTILDSLGADKPDLLMKILLQPGVFEAIPAELLHERIAGLFQDERKAISFLNVYDGTIPALFRMILQLFTIPTQKVVEGILNKQVGLCKGEQQTAEWLDLFFDRAFEICKSGGSLDYQIKGMVPSLPALLAHAPESEGNPPRCINRLLSRLSDFSQLSTLLRTNSEAKLAIAAVNHFFQSLPPGYYYLPFDTQTKTVKRQRSPRMSSSNQACSSTAHSKLSYSIYLRLLEVGLNHTQPTEEKHIESRQAFLLQIRGGLVQYKSMTPVERGRMIAIFKRYCVRFHNPITEFISAEPISELFKKAQEAGLFEENLDHAVLYLIANRDIPDWAKGYKEEVYQGVFNLVDEINTPASHSLGYHICVERICDKDFALTDNNFAVDQIASYFTKCGSTMPGIRNFLLRSGINPIQGTLVERLTKGEFTADPGQYYALIRKLIPLFAEYYGLDPKTNYLMNLIAEGNKHFPTSDERDKAVADTLRIWLAALRSQPQQITTSSSTSSPSSSTPSFSG